MKKSTKIWLALAGILLVALGIFCICRPASTLFATAWLIGALTLVAGIFKLVFTLQTQAFLPNSGTRMLSALLLIILGIIFLCQNLFVTFSLPVIFAMWVLIEGIMTAVQSFDYKKSGYKGWWLILLMGIGSAALGILCLRNPDVSVKTLSLMIGIGLIVLGAAYLIALIGIGRFQDRISKLRKGNEVDEQ